MRLDIVDLSHHNDVRSFEDMAAEGVVGVILKATEGSDYEDDTYQQRAFEARDAGLKVASYHFLRSGAVEQQMRWFMQVVQPVDGERLVIDHEADASLEELEQAVDYLFALDYDLQLTVYSGHLIKEQLGNGYSPSLADKTSLWIAQYGVSSPTWPVNTWPVWSLWQYSDGETVQGAVGPVDGNQFNGPPEACAAWMGPPIPPPPEERYYAVMHVKPGARLLINGVEYVAAGGD